MHKENVQLPPLRKQFRNSKKVMNLKSGPLKRSVWGSSARWRGWALIDDSASKFAGVDQGEAQHRVEDWVGACGQVQVKSEWTWNFLAAYVGWHRKVIRFTQKSPRRLMPRPLNSRKVTMQGRRCLLLGTFLTSISRSRRWKKVSEPLPVQFKRCWDHV